MIMVDLDSTKQCKFKGRQFCWTTKMRTMCLVPLCHDGKSDYFLQWHHDNLPAASNKKDPNEENKEESNDSGGEYKGGPDEGENDCGLAQVPKSNILVSGFFVICQMMWTLCRVSNVWVCFSMDGTVLWPLALSIPRNNGVSIGSQQQAILCQHKGHTTLSPLLAWRLNDNYCHPRPPFLLFASIVELAYPQIEKVPSKNARQFDAWLFRQFVWVPRSTTTSFFHLCTSSPIVTLNKAWTNCLLKAIAFGDDLVASHCCIHFDHAKLSWPRQPLRCH